jgi:regulator of protease activity HflC (stomatin/prohibitin superfamily)
MKSLLFIVLLFSAFSAYSQDNAEWKIIINKKTIFSAKQEDEQKNIDTISLSDVKPNKNFIISYFETIDNAKKSWKRIIGIYNESDKELIRKDAVALKLNTTQVRKWLFDNKKIKIYSWSLPKDPKEAARVRVRRVHLCTIVLK